jgi:hypothetical protein
MGDLTTQASEAFLPVGDASQVQNINPSTLAFSNLLFGADGGAGLLNQTTAGLGDTLAGGADPTAGFNYFLNNLAPGLQNLTSATTNPFVQSLFGQADVQAGQAVQDVLSQFSGQNALYSGAALNRALTEAGNVRGNFLGQALGAQTNLAGGLLGGGLQAAAGLFPQTSLAQRGQGLDFATSLLGLGGGLAAPEYYAPSYVQNPNFLSVPGLIGTGVDFLSNTLGLGIGLAGL